MEKPQPVPREYFFGVGPTAVEPRYAETLDHSILYITSHRDPRFVKRWLNLMGGLRELLELNGQKPFLTSGYSTAQYSNIAQLVKGNESVLVVNSGPYGEVAMGELKAEGVTVHELPVEWGRSVDPNQLEQEVKNVNPSVVLVIGSETPVGTYHLIPDLRCAIGADTLLVVDEVSLMGGYHWDRSEVDFGFAGTQKCFMLPPGVQIGYVSEAAMERAKHAVGARIRNLDDLAERAERGDYMATENTPLVLALERRLFDLSQDGGAEFINGRTAKLNEIYEAFLGQLAELGISSFPERKDASPTVGVYSYNPERVNLNRVEEAMRRDSTIIGGYDGVKIDTGFSAVNERLMRERRISTGRIPLFGQEPELVRRILESQSELMRKFSK